MRSPGISAIAAGSSPSDRVWKLSRIRPRCGWFGERDDLPGLAVALDVAAPGQRLEADAQVPSRRPLGEGVQLRRRALGAGERARRGVRADQQQRRAELLHQVELVLGAVEVLREQLVGHALEVAERLVQVDRQAEVGAHRGELARRRGRMDEVVLEQLDRVEARRGDRRQLLAQGAAQRDRGDGTAHDRTIRVGLASASDVEEDGLVLALQADVEAVDGGAAVGLRRAARRRASARRCSHSIRLSTASLALASASSLK